MKRYPIKIHIDDRCLERLLDVVEGKIVLNEDERENTVSALRQMIKDYRWKFKMEMTMKGLTLNSKKQ